LPFWRRCDRIAKTDINLQRDARTIQLRLQVNPYATIARLLADHRAFDRGRVERDAILHLDLADLPESGLEFKPLSVAGGADWGR